MWKKNNSSKPQKSYNYFKRVKEFRDEIQEFGIIAQDFLELLDALESRCNEIIEKEELRIEQKNGVK